MASPPGNERGRVQLKNPVLDAKAGKTVAPESADHPWKIVLGDDAGGTKDQQPAARWPEVFKLLNHLGNGMSPDRYAASRAVTGAQASVEQAQKVMDLRQGTHGGTRTPRLIALPYRNGRTQALDGIHLRSIQALQKLSRTSRQRFEIASLSFGKERVKSQGGFSRTADAGNHDKLVAGNSDVDVFQIMLASASNDNTVHTHPENSLSPARSGPSQGSSALPCVGQFLARSQASSGEPAG